MTVLKRPGADSTLAWMASHPSTEYSSYGSTNTAIMQKIAAEIESTWVGVTTVFVMHYKCISDPTHHCGVKGFAALEIYPPGSVPGFTGRGETQHIDDWPAVSGRHAWFAMHEFGHLLGLGHSPRTSGDGYPRVNMGRYDLMAQGPSEGLLDGGIVPYNSIALADIGWLPVVELTQDATGVEIADAFDPEDASGVLVRVNEHQAFFMVNHQAANSYEARYAGTGLLLWHIALQDGVLSPVWSLSGHAAIWDLELASGKIDTITFEPDPDEGLDALERNAHYRGSSDDFFDGVVDTEFSCQTNPNSNLYDDTEWTEITTTPQHVRSWFAVENISVNPSGVVSFDVRMPQSFFPNGGEELTRGTTETVLWDIRCGDCASVDILLSRDGGATYCVLAESQLNTGSYEWHMLEAGGDQCRVRVVSHGPCDEAWSDESDSDFSIVDLRTCQ